MKYSSLRLTDYAVPFAPGSIDIGSLFEFIEYFIFVNSKGLTIECIADSFYPKPYAYQINFCESVLYGDYLITELKLDRPDSCPDFAWYEGFKVSNHLTWIKKHGQHENYTLLEIRGWKMHSIQIPTNFQPEDEDKPLWPIMLRVIKAIKFGLKNNSSPADIEMTLNQIPHPALIISRPESISSWTYLSTRILEIRVYFGHELFFYE